MTKNELGYRITISHIMGSQEFQEYIQVKDLSDLKSKLTELGATEIGLVSISFSTDMKDKNSKLTINLD